MGAKYEELIAKYQTDVLAHIQEARRLYERVKELETKYAALAADYERALLTAHEAIAQAHATDRDAKAVAREQALAEIDARVKAKIEDHVHTAHSKQVLSDAACDALARRLAKMPADDRPRRRTPGKPGRRPTDGPLGHPPAPDVRT